MLMKGHYQLFPFSFFKLNLEQIYFIKFPTKCMLKYYIETKSYCSKTKYSETSFLILKLTGCSVSKAIYELISACFFNLTSLTFGWKVINLLIYNCDHNPSHYLLWRSCCSLTCVRKLQLEAKSQFNFRLTVGRIRNVG